MYACACTCVCGLLNISNMHCISNSVGYDDGFDGKPVMKAAMNK